MNRNVLLIEDHPLVRVGLRSVLRQIDPTVQVCEASTVGDAIGCLASQQFAFVLYDWHLPRADGSMGGGMRGLVTVCETAPGTPVIVVSGDDDAAIRYTALRVGAVDFLSKSTAEGDFTQALASRLAGPAQAGPSCAGPLPGAAPLNGATTHDADRPPAAVPQRYELTARQSEVLQWLLQGQPNKWIARTMGLAEPTVRAHISALLKILHARNRTEAVIKAGDAGLSGSPVRDVPDR